ncbi:hypothetical protein QBC38DRAFT_487716 [Podospora fimiseda]|uniref:HD domain-containing protein n=1 Tax=Podospora fimiseda TaxID=252190 RepID=A0AAN7BHN4_9PEZI|nr:hypothetical protein QBC38DRAFT_487716 [Podospora fimiseda]
MHLNLLPLLVMLHITSSAHVHIHAHANTAGPRPNHPVKTIASIKVIDTPLVRAAQDLAHTHNDEHAYKHVMRSWLFGVLLISHNETLRRTIDLEVHAVAALLHDLGWDKSPTSPFVSPDRRFEVDGAIASRNFIRSHPHGSRWEERRVQLVWDAIALHTEPRIAWFKEPDVEVVQKGIGMDFSGPGFGVTRQEYDAVLREFPTRGFRDNLNGTMIWLCQTKPQSTYETFIQPWGDRYVAGYEAQQTIDGIFRNFP